MKLLMRYAMRYAVVAGLALALTPLVAPQARPYPHQAPTDGEAPLPTTKAQQEEILKADHERDLKDVAQLIELAGQLKEELEKNDRHVLSISSLKKTDEIEKLAKRIHSRLVR